MSGLSQFLFATLVLFLPILAANQAGAVSDVLNLPLSTVPVSTRWLGRNKTLAPYYVAPFLSWAVFYWLGSPQLWPQAIAIGCGAVLGDHVKSFLKRRLGYPPGVQWWPDRIDFSVGGGLAELLVFPRVTIWHVAAMVFAAYPLHYAGNLISYHLGWRKTPH